MTQNHSLPLDFARTRRARRRGVTLVILSAAGFSISAAFVKTIGTGIPVVEVFFFRSAFMLLPLLTLVIGSGGLAALRMRNPGSHVLRTIFGMMGVFGSFYGFVYLPLVTATALCFTSPLFLTLLAIPILGEKVGWRRWLAVLVGFSGVLLMLRAEQGATDTQWLALGICLFVALAYAFSLIAIRKMGEAGESGVAIVFWFALFSAVLAGIAMIPVWVWPNPTQWVLLAGIGLVSGMAQIMMTNAYRRGEASLLAPFEYSSIIWTTVLGASVWAEMPDAWDFLGILVLVGAGLYISVQRRDINETVASFHGLSFADLADPDTVDKIRQHRDQIPGEVARRHRILPLQRTDHGLRVAISDPMNFEAFDAVPLLLKTEVEFLYADPESVDTLIADLYPPQAMIEGKV